MHDDNPQDLYCGPDHARPFSDRGKADPMSESDNPVAIVGGRPCVPGSSLKGALRAELEHWLNDQYFQSHWMSSPPAMLSLQPCIPATKRSADEDRLVREKHYRPTSCRYPLDNRGFDRNRGPATPQQLPSICPACYLLGAQGLVGFVSVPFLFAGPGYAELYSARLERTSHTVMQGSNRAYQLIPPETVFSGEMTVLIKDDVLGWEIGRPRPLGQPTGGDAWLTDGDSWNQARVLKNLIVDRLEAIDQLGGYRSKGFGSVKIDVKEV